MSVERGPRAGQLRYLLRRRPLLGALRLEVETFSGLLDAVPPAGSAHG